MIVKRNPVRETARKKLPPLVVLLLLAIIVILIKLSFFTSEGSTESVESKIENSSLSAESSENVEPDKDIKEIICLDPGHGGIDLGASVGEIVEKEINLIVANEVRKSLEAKNYNVFLTRTTDEESLSRADRYEFCNQKKASILVSIHHNTYEDDSSVDYSTALYYTEADQILSGRVLSRVAEKLSLRNAGIAFFNSGILSKSAMPATIVESFFITNKNERNLLAESDERLILEAAAITEGINDYFTLPKDYQPPIDSNPLVIDRADYN
jgi:N-acetylmuramoyl-L-alanine amidase